MIQLFSFERTIRVCGDDGKKDPPVPIPNTEVKLLSAEDSDGFPVVKAGRCHALYILRRFSSVGRASALQAEGHRFKSCNLHPNKGH